LFACYTISDMFVLTRYS